MNDFPRALEHWSLAAKAFAADLTKIGALKEWSAPELASDELIFVLTGPRYTLRLAPRVVGLTTKGQLSVQTSLRVTNRLAEALATDLNLQQCWREDQRNRFCSFNIYVEWLAGNAITPAKFTPTRWTLPPTRSEAEAWLQLLAPIRGIVDAACTDTPLYPLLQAEVERPARLPGSPPQWGRTFDRLVASLDTVSAGEVVRQVGLELGRRKKSLLDKPDPVACELRLLRAWLSGPHQGVST
jgi:hypothetical protein